MIQNFISTMILSGCVTTHYLAPQTVANGKLNVSCSNPEWLTDHYAAVSCTFENNTEDFVALEASDVHMTSPSLQRPLNADQTSSFLSSYRFKTQQAETTTHILLNSLVVTGLAAGLSGHAPVSEIGTGSALAAAGTGVIRHVASELHTAQHPDYAENHLLGPKTGIPAKLFVRRSAIFKMDAATSDIAGMQICLTQPVAECFMAQTNSAAGNARRRVKSDVDQDSTPSVPMVAETVSYEQAAGPAFHARTRISRNTAN